MEENANPINPELGEFLKSELSVVAPPKTCPLILSPPRTTSSVAMSPETAPVPYLRRGIYGEYNEFEFQERDDPAHLTEKGFPEST